MNNFEHLRNEAKDSERSRREYRVAIFGSSEEISGQDREAIQNAKIAAGIAIEQGYSIATGGYNKGVMRAASEEAVKKAGELGIDNAGLVVKSFVLNAKTKIETVNGTDLVESDTLIERLKHLIDESSAFIILGGGTGTIVELISTLQSERVQRMLEDKESASRPIIIIDPSMELTDLLAALSRRDKKLKSDAILDEIYIFSHSSNIPGAIKEILDSYYKKKNGEPIPEETKQRLQNISLKKFLYSQENFTEGAGI